jgi:NAD-dependent deacetylase
MNTKVLFFTGAGISVESGIPTYRGAGGIYNNTPIADILCKTVYEKDPDRVNEILDTMADKVHDCDPNAAHFAVAEMQRIVGATVITQNVDDLFERAGCTDVIHVHGELRKVRCTSCHKMKDLAYGEKRAEACTWCGGKMRYEVVLFDELAPKYLDLHNALKSLGHGDYFVAVGTSGVVLPLNNFVRKLKKKRVITYLNNYDLDGDVHAGRFTKTFMGKATEKVPELCDHIYVNLGILTDV